MKNGLHINSDGTKQWYQNGQLHREDGPAYIDITGVEGWFKHGQLHREDGPAITTNIGLSKWYLNGKLHRLDGPAIIDVSKLSRPYEWWLNGLCIAYSEQEFENYWIQQNLESIL